MSSPPSSGAWEPIDIGGSDPNIMMQDSNDPDIDKQQLNFAESPLFIEREEQTNEEYEGGEPFPLTECKESKIDGDENLKVDAETNPTLQMFPCYQIPPPGKKEKIIIPKKKVKKILPPLSKSGKNSSSMQSSPSVMKSPLNPRIEKEIGRRSRAFFIEQQRKQKIQELQKSLEEKDQRTDEKLRENAEKKYQHACQKYIERQQKTQIANEKKAINENEYRYQAYEKLQKEDEAEERLMEQKQKQAEDLQWKAADRYIKQRFAAQAAKQLARRKEAAALQKMRRNEERIVRFEEEKRARREEELAERRAVQQALEQMKAKA